MYFFNSRSFKFINALKFIVWPLAKIIFRIEIKGLEHIDPNRNFLFIANHNSGALLESHSLLFILIEKIEKKLIPFGFTHPSLFKIPVSNQYFKLIGAVPATFDCAKEIFKQNNSLLIFPGGNRQALRNIYSYKENSFRNSHGWAKIAIENDVPVLPVTFKGTHFLNPILISNEWLAKYLVIPKMLGVSQMSISLGQILSALVVWNLFHSILVTFLTFILTPLLIIIPWKVKIEFHPPVFETKDQNILEDKVNTIMDQLYK